MAVRLEDQYPNSEPADTNYPGGSFKNETSLGAADGTPLEKVWADDLLGARDAVMKLAGQGYSGAADNANTSDFLTALLSLFLRNVDAVSVAAANKAIRRDANGRAKIAAPSADDDIARLADVNTRAEKGAGVFSDNGYFEVDTTVGTFIIQFGISAAISPDTNVTLTLPIAFPTAPLRAFASITNASTSNDDVFAKVRSITTTQISLRAERTSNPLISGTRYIEYLAIGY